MSESYPEGLSWSEGGPADRLALINCLCLSESITDNGKIKEGLV